MPSDKILIQEEPRGPSILVEVPITIGAQRVPFPDVQQLRSQIGQVIIIKKVRILTVKVLARGIIQAAANMPRLDLINAAAVFYAEGWEKGKYIPLLLLNDMVDSDGTAATTIPYKNSAPAFDDWSNVDWSQSYIQFCNGITASATGVFIFEVQYVKLVADDYKKGIITEIIGPS